MKKEFDFDTGDMIMIRDKIISEFEKGYICTEQPRSSGEKTKNSELKKNQQGREKPVQQ